MTAQFWPCPDCSRQVKRTDAACPFCGAAASIDIGPTRVLAGRLSRAALFARRDTNRFVEHGRGVHFFDAAAVRRITRNPRRRPTHRYDGRVRRHRGTLVVEAVR